jgi:hypothetical protein
LTINYSFELENGTPWLTLERACPHHTCVPNISKDDLDGVQLNELTYKKIVGMIDEDFLQQGVRARVLEGVRLANIDSEKGEMSFLVRSSEHSSNNLFYANTIRFDEWNDVVDETDLNPIGRARLLMFDGNVRLNCTCPSFLYHGYRYLLDRQEASIFPEKRPPRRNNPHQRGIVCKHMNRVLKAFPFYSGDLARHIKQHHNLQDGKTRSWDMKSKMADIMRKNKTIEVPYEEIA